MLKRIAQFPDHYHERISRAVESRGLRLTQSQKIAECVLKLSDFYTQAPNQSTPWQENWAQIATLCYYFPLNYLRARAVAQEAERLGFHAGLNSIIDGGAGTGSGLLAFSDQFAAAWKRTAVDVSDVALQLAEQMASNADTRSGIEYHNRDISREPLDDFSSESPRVGQQTLITASYVLTELAEIPADWQRAEALAIIEPATHQDGRKLLALRAQLIESGYQIWAPCTHMQACPLQTHSARDWCHDRIHISAPKWLTDIESHLPMRNRTLTFSYLLARRSSAPPKALADLARLTGDCLEEKGKNRQSVCRGPEREFLAWFPKKIETQRSESESRRDAREKLIFGRGNLVQLAIDLPKKSNEIRLSSAHDAIEIAPDQTVS